MNWFLIAFITPIVHAIANHFDKYLISRFFKGGSVGALILFSALFAVVVLPIIWILEPTIFQSVNATQSLILMGNGALLVLAILCYLYAMEIDEASFVIPFFQLIPVFGFLFGYIFLGEVLTSQQLLAAAVILLGSTALSLEFSAGKFKLKKKLVLFMTASSILYAISGVIFKYVALEQGFMESLFWDMLGKVVFGLILFAAISSYRRQFLNVLKTNRTAILGLNFLNEIISLTGEIAVVFAIMLAPVVLVQSIGGLQPLFVFVIGIVITLFFPKLGKESITRGSLIHKIVAIAIITVGVVMLDRA